jgi:hypothetical protein
MPCHTKVLDYNYLLLKSYSTKQSCFYLKGNQIGEEVLMFLVILHLYDYETPFKRNHVHST